MLLQIEYYYMVNKDPFTFSTVLVLSAFNLKHLNPETSLYRHITCPYNGVIWHCARTRLQENWRSSGFSSVNGPAQVSNIGWKKHSLRLRRFWCIQIRESVTKEGHSLNTGTSRFQMRLWARDQKDPYQLNGNNDGFCYVVRGFSSFCLR